VQSIFAPSFILSSLPQTLKRPSSPTHSTAPSLRPKPSVAENLQPSISVPTLPSPNPTTSSVNHSNHSVEEELEFYFSGSNAQVNRKPSQPTTTRKPSKPARNSPPPSFLLDDDPFADLTPRRFVSSTSTTPPSSRSHTPSTSPSLSTVDGTASVLHPRSHLSPMTSAHSSRPASLSSNPDSAVDVSLPPSLSSTSKGYQSPTLSSSSASSAPPTPTSVSTPRTVTSSGHSTRPVYQRPAFAQRPSMPSLQALAEVNIVIPKKVRPWHILIIL